MVSSSVTVRRQKSHEIIFEIKKVSNADFNNDEKTMFEIFRIFENYNSRLRPQIGKTLNVTGFVCNKLWVVRDIAEHMPNLIKANIYVGSISKLNQEDMRYDMDVFFRMFWNDPRLDLSNFTNKITTG